MKYFSFKMSGRYGHFKKPETNNNPLTYALIHKTAIMGLIGGTLGIRREIMRGLFPQFCDSFLVSIIVNNPVIKECHGFTSRKAVIGSFLEKGRKYWELIRRPEYVIGLACKGNHQDKFDQFMDRVQNKKSLYSAYMGVCKCPAAMSFIRSGTAGEEEQGEFLTKGIISSSHELRTSDAINLEVDKIPTFQTNTWYNPRDRFVSVVFSPGETLSAVGKYRHTSTGECLWFF
jgi:CRISPR-associated protein Cas5 subtype I-B